MENNSSIGWLKEWAPPQAHKQGDLERYLGQLKDKFFKSDSNYTESIWQNFNKTLNRHFNRLETFLSEPNLLLQNLVLGNVQSGKTGHLMANIAWANDKNFDLVILLNGNKTTLSKQTAKRVSKDLGSTVEMHHVQTEANKDFENFVLKLGNAMSKRKLRAGTSLPVAVLIKNSSRIDGLREGLLSHQQMQNAPLRVLVLDDEADQASPDTTTSKVKKETSPKAVHSALVRLAESIHGKTIYLSYTATPQALLHQDRDALHQPQYCSIVPSGPSYFGIAELLETPFALGDFDDLLSLEPGDTDSDKRDGLLEKLLIEFLISSWIHTKFKSEFHSGDISCKAKSVQMLIHPSGNQQAHRDFAASFESLREDLIRVLENQEARDFFIENTLGPVFQTVTYRAGLLDITKELAKDCLDYVFGLFRNPSDLKICIINSDERYRLASTGQDAEFLPADDEEWNDAAAWILIGGDILGRGLTIPHLVSTLFVRNPRNPNFDTAVQQMRFCGYRKSYRKLIRVVAPKEILQDYVDSVEVDLSLRRSADEWDKENRDLRNNPPAVIHIAPKDSRLRATRSSVISRDVKKVISGATNSTLNWIGNTGLSPFQNSLSKFDSALVEVGIELQGRGESGIVSQSISPETLLKIVSTLWPEQSDSLSSELLKEISSNTTYSSQVFGKSLTVVLDLPTKFESFRDLSSEIQKLLSDPIRKGSDIGYRTLAGNNSEFDASAWVAGKVIAPLAVQVLVGDSERAIRDSFPDSAIFLVKPFVLTRDGKKAVAVSLAGILWLPSGAPQIYLHTGETVSHG